MRDTFEVPKSRLKIDRSWMKTLRPLLAEFSSELGLPPGTELDAELHSMLVYSKGQFFLPHQDSEKKTMILSGRSSSHFPRRSLEAPWS